MKAFTSIIGWIVITLSILGATVPGLNFHVIFADDQSTMEFHKERADRLSKKLAQTEKQRP